MDTKTVSHAKSQLVTSAKTVLPSSTALSAFVEEKDLAKKPISLKTDSAAIKAIQAKLVAYCRYTNTDLLTPENLIEKVRSQQEEFNVPDNADIYKNQLDIDAIETVLSRRKKLSNQKKKQLLEALQQSWAIRPNLSINSVTAKAYDTLENYFQSVDWSKVSLEDIRPEITSLLEQTKREGAIALLNWQTIGSYIHLPENTKTEFIDWLQTAFSHKLQSLQPTAIRHTQNLSHQLNEQITHLLNHSTKAALTPSQLTESLIQTVGNTVATLPEHSLISHPSHIPTLWNKEKWQQALEQRKDLTQTEIEQVLKWGETRWQPKAQQLGRWLQEVQTAAREHISLPNTSTLTQPKANTANQMVDQLIETKENIAEQVGEVKESIAEQVNDVKTDIQRQADVARGQVAIAAWWLFIALISSGSAAAGAGYLAATY